MGEEEPRGWIFTILLLQHAATETATTNTYSFFLMDFQEVTQRINKQFFSLTC